MIENRARPNPRRFATTVVIFTQERRASPVNKELPSLTTVSGSPSASSVPEQQDRAVSE